MSSLSPPRQGVEINSIVTAAPSILIVPAGPPQPAELKIDSNPPATAPPPALVSPVPGSNFFGGSVIDAGRMIANTSNPLAPTNVIFAGGALIGPGDLNGNLDAGPSSSFTFTNTGEFAVDATLGPGTGSAIIASAVTVDGTLQDNTMAMSVVPGGAGEVVNSGRLQLDLNSSTVGLGSYQQTSTGTLALAAASPSSYAFLTVTNTAQLSGNLILMGYTPVVGDAFIVVRAGAIEDHFDTIPDGMEETDGPTNVTVTQVRPPAGSASRAPRFRFESDGE